MEQKNIAIPLISLSFLAELPPDALFIFFKKAYQDPCAVALFFLKKERQTWKGLNHRRIIIQEML